MAQYDRTQVFTVSSIETFAQCASRFFLLYVDGKIPESIPEARRGTIIHEAINKFITVNNKQPNPDPVSWRDIESEINILDEDIDELSFLFSRLERCYPELKKLVPIEAWGSIQTETPFSLNVRGELCTLNDPDAIVCGTRDLKYIDEYGNPVVIDFKTGRNVFDGPIEKNKQMRVYAYASLLEHPESSQIALGLDYIRHEISGFQHVYIKREEFVGVWNEIIGWAQPIVEALSQYKQLEDKAKWTEIFRPNPNARCGWCSAKMYCNYWNNALSKMPDSKFIMSKEQALSVAKTVWAVEKRAKELKETLREFIAEFGPLEDTDSGYVLDTYPEDRDVVNTQVAIAMLIKGGVNSKKVWDNINLPKTALSTMLRGKGENISKLREEVFKTAVKKIPSTRFEWRKK